MASAQQYPWGDERRFHSYNLFLRQQFGGRLQKLTIDAGFTCPNRDGRCGTGGCTYCLNAAFNPNYCTPAKSIATQLTEGMEFHRHRSRNLHGYLAYFQAFSNTYAPLEKLRALYEEALTVPGVQGLIIATRPDCLGDDVLDYLQELSARTYVSVEIGIESFRDETLGRIHRGHNSVCAIEAVERTHARGIPVGTHLIFGLPGETPEHWMEDLAIVNRLPVHDIKFHQLQILKGTQMERDFTAHPTDFHRFTFEEYLEFIVTYLEHLRPGIVIERFASEVPPRLLAVPGWKNIRYDAVLRCIEEALEHRNTWQGKLL